MRGWHDFAAWGRAIKALCDVPRASEFFGLGLDVALGHIQPDAVTEYVIKSLVNFDVPPAFTDCGDQFDFVMDLVGRRRQDEAPRRA